MMGEYLLYYRKVLFGGIYDNRLLVKIVESNKKYNMSKETPYEKAKLMFLVDNIDDKDELKNIVNYKNYSELNLEEKENIIKQLMNLLKCNSTNANFKFLNSKYSSVFGRKHSKTINHATIISKSVTGIRESKYEF